MTSDKKELQPLSQGFVADEGTPLVARNTARPFLKEVTNSGPAAPYDTASALAHDHPTPSKGNPNQIIDDDELKRYCSIFDVHEGRNSNVCHETQLQSTSPEAEHALLSSLFPCLEPPGDFYRNSFVNHEGTLPFQDGTEAWVEQLSSFRYEMPVCGVQIGNDKGSQELPSRPSQEYSESVAKGEITPTPSTSSTASLPSTPLELMDAITGYPETSTGRGFLSQMNAHQSRILCSTTCPDHFDPAFFLPFPIEQTQSEYAQRTQQAPDRGKSASQKRAVRAPTASDSSLSVIPVDDSFCGQAFTLRTSNKRTAGDAGTARFQVLANDGRAIRTCSQKCQFPAIGEHGRTCNEEVVDDWNLARAHVVLHLADLGLHGVASREPVYCYFCKEVAAQSGNYLRHVLNTELEAGMVECECGGSYSRGNQEMNRSRHMKTKRHKEWLQGHRAGTATMRESSVAPPNVRRPISRKRARRQPAGSVESSTDGGMTYKFILEDFTPPSKDDLGDGPPVPKKRRF